MKGSQRKIGFKLSLRKKPFGFTLLEVMIVVAIMSITMLALMTMLQNQVQSTNFIDFQLKRTQLHSTIVGQFLPNPNNCKCLFGAGTTFSANPAPPGATITAQSPIQIGQYTFGTPGDCSTASMPQPWIKDTTAIDGMTLTSAQITNIMNIGPNIYTGNFVVSVRSSKEVLGPRDLSFSIPVSIATNSVGGFAGCASTTPGGMGGCAICHSSGASTSGVSAATTCGGAFPVYRGVMTVKSADGNGDWDGSIGYGPGCSGDPNTYYPRGQAGSMPVLCCSN